MQLKLVAAEARVRGCVSIELLSRSHPRCTLQCHNAVPLLSHFYQFTPAAQDPCQHAAADRPRARL